MKRNDDKRILHFSTISALQNLSAIRKNIAQSVSGIWTEY